MSSRKRILTVFIFLILLAAITSQAAAQAQPGQHTVVIYIFWGEGCPHCAKAKPYFENLAQANPLIVLREYEVYNNPDNHDLMLKVAAKYNFEASAVPTILIGPYHLIGYSEEMNAEIESTIQTCVENGCEDAGIGLIPEALVLPTASPTQTSEVIERNQITLPILGTVDLEHKSLALSTFLIAFVDGVNPCSLWVLSMLMALTIHTGSRKKVLIIGLIFLTVTAAVYALFITGLFSVLKIVSFLGWVQALVAVVALVFAAINIKDYFWYKEGISLTISDERKPGIYQNIRRIINSSDSIWGLAGATIVMAAGVSLVEFSCTAGFPVIWTNLLVAQKVSAGVFVLLLLLYMFIYQIDELVIFGSVVFTLKASRLEEKQGRILKLFGGTLMLALAIVMLVDPSLMNNLTTSVLIFLAAFLLSGLILLVHRVVLPAFGIWLGTEKKPKRIVRAHGHSRERAK